MRKVIIISPRQGRLLYQSVGGLVVFVWFSYWDSCDLVGVITRVSKSYHTYIIESITTGKWYYGATSDLSVRLGYHNAGWNRSWAPLLEAA